MTCQNKLEEFQVNSLVSHSAIAYLLLTTVILKALACVASLRACFKGLITGVKTVPLSPISNLWAVDKENY